MPFEFKLAYKYFRARRKSLARFTSLVAVVGIAAGVASLIVAQALAQGFADEMRDKILVNTAHVSVFMKDAGAITNWREIANDLETIENVRQVSPTAYENSLVVGASESAYAVLKVENRNNLKGSRVAIGARLAEKLNLKAGDAADVMTLDNQTPTRVAVAETFETGLFDYDSTWIYMTPEKFAQLRGQTEFTPSTLSVSVKDIFRAGETAREIRRRLDENFRVLDWQEANRPLFAALSLERKVALAVIGLIIFIAALNITTTLALLVNERRLDIAVLRTCGARARSLIAIFFIEGSLLALVGIAAGVAIGLLGCLIGNYFRIVSIPADVYALNYIPLRPDAANILLLACAAFLLCLAATVYPAFKASRIKPL